MSTNDEPYCASKHTYTRAHTVTQLKSNKITNNNDNGAAEDQQKKKLFGCELSRCVARDDVFHCLSLLLFDYTEHNHTRIEHTLSTEPN